MRTGLEDVAYLRRGVLAPSNAALADRRRKLIELGIREDAARIARVGLEKLDRHAALAAEVAKDAITVKIPFLLR